MSIKPQRRLIEALRSDDIIQIQASVESGECVGFCAKCGAEHCKVEPAAEYRTCEMCEEEAVLGAEQLGVYLLS